MVRRSPARLLACLLALATGMTLLELSHLVAEPPVPGRPVPASGPSVGPEAAARDGPAGPVRLRQPLLRAPFEPPPAPLTLGLARLTFAPGAWLPPVVLSGPALFTAEAGTLAVWAEGRGAIGRVADGAPFPSPAALNFQRDLAVRPGEQVLVVAGTTFALRNTAATPAVVLGAAVLPGGAAPSTSLGHALFGLPAETPIEAFGGTAPLAETWPPGVIVQPLAGVDVGVPPGPATLAVERWTLAPGTALPEFGGDPGLLVVEAGVLGLSSDRGAGRFPPSARTTKPTASPGADTRFGTGEAAMVPAEAAGTARNAGDVPLVALVVTIDPATP
jgi:mannose-6-phosphate isomerase-like protein (cupin superfamily)